MSSSQEQVAFPTLSPDQIDQLRPHGVEGAVEAGDMLFEAGEKGFDFFVVLEGEIEILDPSTEPPARVAVHAPGEFTGDVDMVGGRSALVTAKVKASGRVLRVPPETLKAVIAKMPGLSDVILQAFLMRRTLLMDQAGSGLQIVGSRFSEATHHLKGFAERNDLPYTWLDLERDEGAEALLQRLGVPTSDTPVVIVRGDQVLRDPSTTELARHVGLGSCALPTEVVDLVVVGGGPAGLAASVYGASEGLSTLCLDAEGIGGQAAWSSKIENYLGFPSGISGAELASRARLQAEKFGAEIAVPRRATGLQSEDGYYAVHLEEDDRVLGRSVVIATGADYRKLPLDRRAEFDGAGVYYGATRMEAQLCRNEEILLVGGGNSAGQAALFLSESAQTVHLLIRGGDLGKSMSRYLVDRIQRADDVEVHLHTEAVSLHGEDKLEAVVVENNQTGATERVDTAAATRAETRKRRTAGAIPAPDGSTNTSQSTTTASSTPERTFPLPPLSRAGRPDRATPSFWKRACRASLRWAMCGRGRSSAWPRRWGRARWRSSWCTSFSTAGDELRIRRASILPFPRNACEYRPLIERTETGRAPTAFVDE